MVSTLIAKPKKRKTKKQKSSFEKSNANAAKCRTKRFRDEVIKERGGAKGGFWERKSLSALCLDFDFVHIVNLYTVFLFFGNFCIAVTVSSGLL